jgi:ABC-2 type transport system permease protein
MLLTLGYTASKVTAKQSSAQIASVLLSIWLVVTVLIPAGSDLAIDEMVESPNGGEIVLMQRESVNNAWDLPFSTTWSEFLATHPQWKGKTQMGGSFEWKWYYAFQQVGDQKAEELSKAYRTATLAKNTLAERFALMSPPMLTQRLMSSIAETDANAAIQYELKIREYHKALRQFYYPFMFNETEFTLEALSDLPKFSNKKI